MTTSSGCSSRRVVLSVDGGLGIRYGVVRSRLLVAGHELFVSP